MIFLPHNPRAHESAVDDEARLHVEGQPLVIFVKNARMAHIVTSVLTPQEVLERCQ